MKRLVATTFVALVMLAAMLYRSPFQLASHGLASVFGAGEETAKLETLYSNPATQEISNGNAPYQSLQDLRAHWAARNSQRRIVVIGNSQTYAVVLAPDEPPPGGSPKSYVDRVAEICGSNNGPLVYRLAAPNLSYPEALWYVTYLASVSGMTPSRIVLQLNYESFRKTGIREGMLELLREPAFADAAQRMTTTQSPLAPIFALAIKRWQDQAVKSRSIEHRDDEREDSHRQRPAAPVEARLRLALETTGIQARQHQAKADLLDLLYRLRVYLLRITPTTPRSLGGATFDMSVRALWDLASTCKQKGIELTLFMAPQNPAARLWRTDSDRTLYRQTTHNLADQFGLRLVNLEDSIPKGDWGVWIDGPDPIHFGLRGHAQMADMMVKAGLFQ